MQVFADESALESALRDGNSSTQTPLQDRQKDTQKDEKKDFAKYVIASYKGETTGFNLLGISIYEMNYFMPLSHNFARMREKSDNNSEVKFQISIKKGIFEDLLGLNEMYYMAYTQTAWWQLYRYSAPFREINYQPELFVDFPLKGMGAFENLRFGLLHSSNGLDNVNLKSRSWNRVYASGLLAFNRLLIIPRVWWRIPEKRSQDDNPLITHYMGNFDFTLLYLGHDFLASSVFRNNLNFKGKNRFAWEFNVGSDILDNGVFWHFQYFVGYAESLIDYKRFANRVSLGFIVAY